MILDDSSSVWAAHIDNLLTVERYVFFPSSARQLRLAGPSLLELSRYARLALTLRTFWAAQRHNGLVVVLLTTTDVSMSKPHWSRCGMCGQGLVSQQQHSTWALMCATSARFVPGTSARTVACWPWRAAC